MIRCASRVRREPYLPKKTSSYLGHKSLLILCLAGRYYYKKLILAWKLLIPNVDTSSFFLKLKFELLEPSLLVTDRIGADILDILRYLAVKGYFFEMATQVVWEDPESWSIAYKAKPF